MILFVNLVLTVIIAFALLYDSNRWQSASKELYTMLVEARLPIESEKKYTNLTIG
jgi:hypothetical protein